MAFIDWNNLSEQERERLTKEQAKGTVEPVVTTENYEKLVKINDEAVKISNEEIVQTRRVPGVVTKIIADEPMFVPKYYSEDASCVDLVANIPEDAEGKRTIKIMSRAVAVIDCGFKMELPTGWQAFISARSGRASEGLIVTNAPGIIDSDYRGRVAVLLANISHGIKVINHGDRIAQMQPMPVHRFEWNEAQILSDSDRGEGGFGSTGESQ
jgi:dUTP pyrophosphatase